MNDFGIKVGRWSRDAEKKMGELHAAIIFKLFSSVILDTPVLEGRLRGNWIITEGSPGEGIAEVQVSERSLESGSSNESARGPITMDRITELVDFTNKIDGSKNFEVFLTNNLPYASRIEFDGWSRVKAPEGMVRKNLVRIATKLETAGLTT